MFSGAFAPPSLASPTTRRPPGQLLARKGAAQPGAQQEAAGPQPQAHQALAGGRQGLAPGEAPNPLARRSWIPRKIQGQYVLWSPVPQFFPRPAEAARRNWHFVQIPTAGSCNDTVGCRGFERPEGQKYRARVRPLHFRPLRPIYLACSCRWPSGPPMGSSTCRQNFGQEDVQRASENDSNK